MTYKTIVIECSSKAKKMAAAIEKHANELAQAGWELVNFSVTSSEKAILLFQMPEDDESLHTEPKEDPKEAAVPPAGDSE